MLHSCAELKFTLGSKFPALTEYQAKVEAIRKHDKLVCDEKKNIYVFDDKAVWHMWLN